MSRTVRIGITAGDVNGIGLEAALKAVHTSPWPKNRRFIIIAGEQILREQCRAFGFPMPAPWDAHCAAASPQVTFWDPCPDLSPRWNPGKIRVDAARAAHEWIRIAARACMDRQLDAMVTAPIAKEGFHRAGIDVPGHTELLAKLTKSRKFAMMLFGGPLRVILVTRHIPIAEVPRSVTAKSVTEATTMAAGALKWMGLKHTRIAVCGLNPHAGEGGDIGLEDKQVIAPAVRSLKRKGLDIHGPLPADTVFHHAAAGSYDAVVAMYHDQGLAPLKLAAFDTGVNLTLGLPIVRTSPDHGTAFDIAGRNTANPSSTIEAIRHAGRLATRPNPWRRN